MARFPCFATHRPAAATTNAAQVEMLKVWQPSPPVPQVSTTARPGRTLVTLSRMARAAPQISATLSPLTCNAVNKAPICAGVACPSMSSVTTACISSSVRSAPVTRRAIASLTVMENPASYSPAGFRTGTVRDGGSSGRGGRLAGVTVR